MKIISLFNWLNLTDILLWNFFDNSKLKRINWWIFAWMLVVCTSSYEINGISNLWFTIAILFIHRHIYRLMYGRDENMVREKFPIQFSPYLNQTSKAIGVVFQVKTTTTVWTYIYELISFGNVVVVCWLLLVIAVAIGCCYSFYMFFMIYFFFSHWNTYLDSADGLQPGAFFHNLNNMPTYSNEIRNSGITYDDKKNETCWTRERVKKKKRKERGC